MERIFGGLGVGAVVLIIAWAAFFLRRGSAGEEYRKLSHEMIAQVEGYSSKPDYYDWLVDQGHDTVFNDSYKVERRGRRSVRGTVDEAQYLDDLFTWMINEARTDNAAAVAAALEKFKAEELGMAEPPPKKKHGYR